MYNRVSPLTVPNMDAPACLADGRWFVRKPSQSVRRWHRMPSPQLVWSAYLPRRLERVRAGRRERMVEQPLFPIYLFVQMPAATRALGGCVSSRVGSRTCSVRESR